MRAGEENYYARSSLLQFSDARFVIFTYAAAAAAAGRSSRVKFWDTTVIVPRRSLLLRAIFQWCGNIRFHWAYGFWGELLRGLKLGLLRARAR